MPPVSYSQRGPMTPITRRVRAYFGPVDRMTSTATVYDPARDPLFDLDTPPSPWIDCGWVQGFRRTSSTVIQALAAGAFQMAQATARRESGAQVEFEFLQWGKLQMAISSGSQQLNLLQEATGASARASGGTAASRVPLSAGSTASELVVGAGNAGSFAMGEIVAVDRDFTLPGYIGAKIAGAYVRSATDVGANPDYTRRVTFNVARIRAVTATALQLEQPLIAGVPTLDMNVQKVIGFVDREGGRFFQEFSALFVAEAEAGGRMSYYYPRVRTAIPAAESRQEIAPGLDAWTLHATLLALPSSDVNDSEQVLCYRSYVPASTAGI
jgi:hypothetical protein